MGLLVRVINLTRATALGRSSCTTLEGVLLVLHETVSDRQPLPETPLNLLIVVEFHKHIACFCRNLYRSQIDPFNKTPF